MNLRLKEFPELEHLQAMLNDFASMTGLTLILLDNEGTPVCHTPIHNRLCTNPVVCAELKCRQCEECRRKWQDKAAREKMMQRYICRNGIAEFIHPILLEGKAVGFLTGGQVLMIPDALGGTSRLPSAVDLGRGYPDIAALDKDVTAGKVVTLPKEWYEHYAEIQGLDPGQYLESLRKITFLTEGKLAACTGILQNLTNTITSLFTKWINEKKAINGLQEIIRDIARDHEETPGSYRRVLENVVNLSRTATNADIAYLYQYKADRQEFIFPPATIGARNPYNAPRQVRPDDLIYETARGKENIFLSDIRDEERAGSGKSTLKANGLLKYLLDMEMVRSLVIIPLIVCEEVVGISLLGFRKSRDFNHTPVLKDYIGLFKPHAALVLQNILLRQETRALNKVKNELDFYGKKQDSADSIIRDLCSRINCTKASLQLIEGDKRKIISAHNFTQVTLNRWLQRPISRDDLIKRVIAQREPTIISDVDTDDDWKVTAGTMDVKSWIGIPIFHKQNLIGLITIDHNQPGFFTGVDKAELMRFTADVSPKIWNLLLLDSAQHLIHNMEAVNEIVQIISADLNPENLFKTIAFQLTEKLNCSHCTIFLEEKRGNEIVLLPKETYGIRPETLSRTFRPGEGIAGWVYRDGESVLLEDAKTDRHFAPERSPNDQPRSMIVAPIKAGNQTIGVISADIETFGWFSESDRQLVDALAVHAGIAVQRSEGLTLLENIGNKIINLQDLDNTQTSVGDILEAVVEGAIQLIKVTTGVIYLIGDDGKSLKAKYHPRDFNHPPPRMDFENGLTRTVLKEGKILPIKATNKEPRVNPELVNQYKSMICVPLKIRENVIGVFFLDDRDEHNFTETESFLLSMLASQAAIAIQNTVLLNDRNKQIESHKRLERQLEELHQVFLEQDLEKVINRIIKGISIILGEGVTTTINLFYQDPDRFGDCQASGPLEEKLKDPPREKSGTGRYVLKTAKSLYLEDVKKPPPGCPTIRPASIKLGIQSFAAIPLRQQEHIVGVLFVNSQQRLRFTEEIKRVLEIFANQAAVVIRNTRLYEETLISGAIMKAADIGFLASGIAHEYYNHIQNMYSLLSILNTSPGEKEKSDILKQFEEEIDKSVKTIDSFRDFRDGVHIASSFDLDQLIKKLIILLEQRSKNHNIAIEYHNQDVRVINMNIDSIRTIIVNLLRNAEDAVEAVAGPKKIKIDVLKGKAGEFEIVVQDSGCGILQEDVDRLFIPYSHGKKKKGMGMGLFWVQKILSRMGGKITIEAKNAWGGATFRVILPNHDKSKSRS